jgi:AcrR family transcriptional regulator
LFTIYHDGVQEASLELGSRDKLLRGALECVQRRGYSRTSSRDIARAAGVNLASINYHFGSKDALLDEALGRCFEMWQQRVEEAFAVSATGDVKERLGAILHAVIDSFPELQSSLHACVESYAPALRSAELRARLAAGYADVRESGVRLSRQTLDGRGVAAPDNLGAIASVLVAVCDGLMLQWIADPSATPNAAETLEALTGLAALASDQ